MTAAETELVAAPDPSYARCPGAPRRRNRRLGTAAASLVIVGGTAGMAAAASGALPGEPLYPIKRGIEQVTTAAHFERRQPRARPCSTRPPPASTRSARSRPRARPTPTWSPTTVDSFRSCRRRGLREAVHGLPGRAATPPTSPPCATSPPTQMADVADAGRRAPTPPTDDLLLDAADTLADIDQQARGLCGTCGPAGAARAARRAQLRRRRGRRGQPARPPGRAGPGRHRRPSRPPGTRPLKAAAEQRAEATAATIPRHRRHHRRGDALAGTAGEPGDPLTSTITPDGSLVPLGHAAAAGAVKDLVTGVTGTVDHGHRRRHRPR